MRTAFDVTNDQIFGMGPEEAVDLCQRLLWAEASRVGIGMNNVNISRRIDVPDGGIDASVREVPVGTNSGLLRPGTSGYQLKTGESFKPWREAQIKKEFFGRKKTARESLGPSIKECLDKNGTYVLVCFGTDLDEPTRKKSEAIIKAQFAQCGYTEANAEVWSANQIIGFLRPFPTLATAINGLDGAHFQTYQSWSKNSDMRGPFQAGALQLNLVEKLREGLRLAASPIHLRISGDPGIGKTRLLLETISADDLNPLVLYCESPGQLEESGFLNEILREDNEFHAILIVDECSQTKSAAIWNKLKSRSPSPRSAP